ncbi:MAG: hydantoinase B/oxoprolinase family protein [Candidatus Heimdallarchaeota archaeon]
MRRVDPVTVEVVRNALVAASDEMKINLARTAYSTIIYEVLDFSIGIFDAKANIIAQAAGLPIFLGNLSAAIEDGLEVIGRDEFKPGDIIVSNDPYTTGTHLCDMTIYSPIFFNQDLVGFAATRAHWIDIGGKGPGGWFTDSTEIYQEGLRLRSVKLYREGEPNEDVLRIIQHNIRFPESSLGDMRAQIAACRTGERRFINIIEKYGKQTVFDGIQEIFDHDERLTRAEVEKIPDGEYSAEAFMDDDGIDIGIPVPIKVKVIIDGSDMTMDLSESSKQVKGSLNSGLAAGISACRVAFKCITTPFLPVNQGSFKPLHVNLPLGTVFSAIEPAPCSTYGIPLMTLIDTIFKALAPAIPDKIPAAHYGDVCATFIYGVDPKSNRPYLHVEPEGGGWGAKSTEDGENVLIAIADGDTLNVPIEAVEIRHPLMIECYELYKDSGGPGKYRGGLGHNRTYKILGHEAGITITYERSKCPPWGIFRGQPGKINQVVVQQEVGEPETILNKATNFRLKPGARLICLTGGGGGYGDPIERDPEMVRLDVIKDYVSLQSAREDYGVVLDPNTLEIDWDATKALRQRMKTG